MDESGTGGGAEATQGEPTVLPPSPPSTFGSLPKTKAGRWAVWLMVAYLALFFPNFWLGMTAVLPPVVTIPVGILALALGLACGVVALVAIIRGRERSWVLWLPVVATVGVVFLLAGELLSALLMLPQH
jgi:hypothetical protein